MLQIHCRPSCNSLRAEILNLSAAVHSKGTKRWFVYPPTYSTYSTVPIFEFLRDVYPRLPTHLKPIEFLQEPGDLVLLPGWVGMLAHARTFMF